MRTLKEEEGGDVGEVEQTGRLQNRSVKYCLRLGSKIMGLKIKIPKHILKLDEPPIFPTGDQKREKNIIVGFGFGAVECRHHHDHRFDYHDHYDSR
jgi:hypothetical protein